MVTLGKNCYCDADSSISFRSASGSNRTLHKFQNVHIKKIKKFLKNKFTQLNLHQHCKSSESNKVFMPYCNEFLKLFKDNFRIRQSKFGSGSGKVSSVPGAYSNYEFGSATLADLCFCLLYSVNIITVGRFS